MEMGTVKLLSILLIVSYEKNEIFISICMEQVLLEIVVEMGKLLPTLLP